MQVLLCGCQIPPFRLRWLQIVWSVGKGKERRFATTHGMAAPYTPVLAPRCLLFDTFQHLFFASSTGKHTVEPQPAFMSSPSHSTLAHITQGRSNVWCGASDVSASPFPRRRTRCCVVCPHSYRSRRSSVPPFFSHLCSGSYTPFSPFLLCCSAV